MNHYQQALDVQNASNISGVAHALAELLGELSGLSNPDRESHPAVVLFVAKLSELTGALYDETLYREAYLECQRLADPQNREADIALLEASSAITDRLAEADHPRFGDGCF